MNNQDNSNQDNSKTKECPFCAEKILYKAIKCKHCGEILDIFLREQRKETNTQQPTPQGGASSSASSSAAVVYQSPLRSFNHIIHLILSIVTGGLWIPIWILAYIFRNKDRYY